MTIREAGRSCAWSARSTVWTAGSRTASCICAWWTTRPARSADLAELRYGLGLQMLLYLFTLRDEGESSSAAIPLSRRGSSIFPHGEKLLNLPRNASEDGDRARDAQGAAAQRHGAERSRSAARDGAQRAGSAVLSPGAREKSKDGETEINRSIARALSSASWACMSRSSCAAWCASWRAATSTPTRGRAAKAGQRLHLLRIRARLPL